MFWTHFAPFEMQMKRDRVSLDAKGENRSRAGHGRMLGFDPLKERREVGLAAGKSDGGWNDRAAADRYGVSQRRPSDRMLEIAMSRFLIALRMTRTCSTIAGLHQATRKALSIRQRQRDCEQD